MPEITKTIKLHLHVSKENKEAFRALTTTYAQACNYVSGFLFNNGFTLNAIELQKILYATVREKFGLKSQQAISVFRTVTARYKTVEQQLSYHPYKYKDDGDNTWKYIPRTLEWLWKPIHFSRPQADLVRGRDYSFLKNGKILSLNTLDKRAYVTFDLPECFHEYFDGTWKFGTGKLVSLLGEWYFHIPVTNQTNKEADISAPSHVVGIDRGLRFLATAYDETGKTTFVSGKNIIRKQQKFADTRAELQSKNTKSAKRALKRISGRENRWMSDVNHRITKTLVRTYGPDTLFVLEDLTGISFAEKNLSRNADANRNLRSWSFYQLEQFLGYKAIETGSAIIKVPARYTSQRCPKCGRIHKENRNHQLHEYICDACGYRSNDDRTAAMNLYELGTMYVSGDVNPRFGPRKIN